MGKEEDDKCFEAAPIFLWLFLLPSRLRRLWGGDQTGSVSAGSGEAVARQLFQMPDMQLHAHRRVHQQVGAPPKTHVCYTDADELQ